MSNVKPILNSVTTVHFDRVDFIQPTRDPSGGSRKLSLRVMPSLMRAAEILVASGKFRYETVSDLIRHAIQRHMDELHQQEPSVNRETFGFLEAMLAQMQDELEGIKFKKVQDKLTEAVGKYRADGREAMAKRSVVRMLKSLEYSMEHSANAKYYWQKVAKEHEDLLKGRKVKMSEGE